MPNTLVSIMMVNNEIGTIHPIMSCSYCSQLRRLFHTDAVCTLGVPIDAVKDFKR